MSRLEEASTVADWYERVGNDLPQAGLGDHGDHGDTGEPLLPLYTAEHVSLDEVTDLGVPGEYPFTRGAYPTGYRKRPWLMVQYAGFGTADETNARWRSLLGAGQRAVSLAFDLPSHLGLDSDDPLAEDEVGKAGTAVDTVDDFERLFDGIDLATTPATFNTAAIAPIVVAMYVVLGEQRGLRPHELAGTITNDPLSSCHRGTAVLANEHGVHLACDLVEYCAEHMPRFTPINVQGVYMRSVGATKAQEVAYTFANAFAYLDDLARRGVELTKVVPRFSAFMQCDSHFFEEAAKFRAARRVWASMVRERYDLTDPDCQRLRLTGVSAARCFTKEEPHINLVRGAYSALGCALGGVQGMWISGYDEALATPTEEASRLALRTMQILAEETGIVAAIDPLAGGYFPEHLTNRMDEMIRSHVADIDEHGGAVAAASSGYMRRQMTAHDLEWMAQRERGERRIVASNYHRSEDGVDQGVEFQRFRDDVLSDQVRRLSEVKSRRDEAAVNRSLTAVTQAATQRVNVMPSVIEAVRQYATVGEVMACFSKVWGPWKESTT